MEQRNKGATTPPKQEVCPDCGAAVRIKSEWEHGEQLIRLVDAMTGLRHYCNNERPLPKHPIGQAVVGQKVIDYQLRRGVLTITLEDGSLLTVSAAGTPLTMNFQGPAGMLQE